MCTCEGNLVLLECTVMDWVIIISQQLRLALASRSCKAADTMGLLSRQGCTASSLLRFFLNAAGAGELVNGYLPSPALGASFQSWRGSSVSAVQEQVDKVAGPFSLMECRALSPLFPLESVASGLCQRGG